MLMTCGSSSEGRASGQVATGTLMGRSAEVAGSGVLAPSSPRGIVAAVPFEVMAGGLLRVDVRGG